MNKFLALISIVSFLTLTSGCTSGSAGGAFATDSGSTINPIQMPTLLSTLDEGLLWASNCEIIGGSRSVVYYLSKSNNELILEADLLEGTECSFTDETWLQATKQVVSLTSDNGSIFTGTRLSNEYMILEQTYLDQANQFSFCQRSNWVLNVWNDVSNSTECNPNGISNPVSYDYQILSDSSVVFMGIRFDR
jgi:hypothetical protein